VSASAWSHPRSGGSNEIARRFTLTSYGGGEFFELAYDNEARSLWWCSGTYLGTCPLLSPMRIWRRISGRSWDLFCAPEYLGTHASAVPYRGQAVRGCSGESSAGRVPTAGGSRPARNPGPCVKIYNSTASKCSTGNFQAEPATPRVACGRMQ